MRFSLAVATLLGLALAVDWAQKPMSGSTGTITNDISRSLFSILERLSRLVDITYCVGTTGLARPFCCASRCKDFPTLELDTTWDTGPLMSDSCGYIAVDHSHEQEGPAIIVAFRGTYSLTNTIIDLSTVPQEYVPYPPPGGDDDGIQKCNNCTVHMGFWQSWNNARAQVMPRLENLRAQHPDYTVHLLGHSLGGAVAALAALELRVSLGWHNIIVTTFGEPRVGNKGLARFIDEVFGIDTGDMQPNDWRYRRLTHVKDPVPLLPPAEWGFRSHAGEIFISKSDLPPSTVDLKICQGDNDDQCSGGADISLAFPSELPEMKLREDASESGIPPRFRLWQLLFAHRDYFWRLGLCVPGGDPADWGRDHRL